MINPMRNLYALCTLLLSCVAGYAQITSVDSACPGAPVAFSGPANQITHTWVTDTVDIDQTPGPFTNMGVAGLTFATFASTNYDNGTWYTFVTFHASNTLKRLTYTGSPNGPFTVATVGTYGSATRLEGIDIVKDPATGDWYGVMVDAGQLFVLSFGSSLANAPTSMVYNFSSQMFWSHQIGLAKYGNNWVAFIGDRASTIKRVDFGTSLTNAPTMTTIPNVGGVSNPCNFAIRNENGNWYMLISNLINGTITRYDFGANITNNSPTGTLLGNPGNLISLPRSICIVSDCNQLIAYVLNENSGLIKLNFGQSITNTPTAAGTGSTGITQQNSLNTYFVDSAMYANIVSFGNNSISRGKLIQFPVFNTTKYYDNTFSHSFSTQGTKNMTLYVNQGSHMGSEAFCKPLVIASMKVLKDTTACSGTALILDASAAGATTYQWNTGATTPAISVTASGKYWVAMTGSACLASDTANVTITPTPVVSLGADTTFCDLMQKLGNKLPNAPGSSFLWNTGSTDSTISATSAGTYWLQVSKNGCTGTDTVEIDVANVAALSLGPDRGICGEGQVTLSGFKDSLAGATYLWSDSSTGPTITVTKGRYWLTVKLKGCEASDTVNVVQVPAPTLSLGGDTFLCPGKTLTLRGNTQPPGTTYKWNMGNTSEMLKVTIPGTYILTVFDSNGCNASDTVAVSKTELPIIWLGEDQRLCTGDTLRLPSEIHTVRPYSIQWQDGTNGTTFVVTTPGVYTATITNACGSAYDEVDVSFNNCHFFFPSGFSPNGDGHNDIARLRGDLAGIEKCELSIYHRRGQRMFHTTDPYSGWDGTFNGKEVGMDTYFYMIKLTFNGEEIMLKGDVTLIR